MSQAILGPPSFKMSLGLDVSPAGPDTLSVAGLRGAERLPKRASCHIKPIGIQHPPPPLAHQHSIPGFPRVLTWHVFGELQLYGSLSF